MSSNQTEILLESGTNELEIVEFFLDEEPKVEGGEPLRLFYGINVAKVLEIVRLPELTEMPEISDPSVLGAFNLRNQIIPLIDLAAWLKKKRVKCDEPKVIVTEFNRVRSAFLVSGVTRIHRINWREVEAPTNYVSSLTANSITGVVKLDKRIVFILDMEKICADLNPDADFLQEPEFQGVEETREKHYKLLLADDSNMARKMISRILVNAGFEVTTVDNGEQAWEVLRRLRDQATSEGRSINDFVDAVVSDVEMPIMDGHNLTKRVKEDPILRELPVVLCSSIVSETLQHKGEAVGADAQVSKAELGDLVKSVKKYLPE